MLSGCTDQLKLALLLDLGSMLAKQIELNVLLELFEERVARALDAERASMWLIDEASGALRTRVANLPETEELRVNLGYGLAGHVAVTGRGVLVNDVGADTRWAKEFDESTGYQTRSMICEPLHKAGSVLGVIQVLNRHEGKFTCADQKYLRVLADQIARALENTSLRPRRRRGRTGVRMSGRFNHVVGSSPAMQEAYDKVIRAASTDATVLLRGETGTGKGLFARAIHVNSNRARGPFVHLDVTAIPPTLIESELFGHERGAFTGADHQVRGKVEIAAGGTLFLDEIDSLPVQLQSKLLRFVQDRQFERVGGRETLTVDLRIVAATNCDLTELVSAGRFRSDLYYRLRVIDIELPPLCARGRGDILSLSEHFLEKFCVRYGKDDLALTADARDALAAHNWPGNVRELEHTIERAVVLAEGAELDVDALGLDQPQPEISHRLPGGTIGLEPGLSLDEATWEYARACLERHRGNQSAASRELGIGRNRLARLMKRHDSTDHP